MTQPIQGVYALRPDVVATVMGDGAVLLDLRTKHFYTANSTAWAVLAAFEEGAEATAVAQACAKCMNGSGDHEAVGRLFEQIMAEDMLEPVAGGGAGSAGGWKGAMAVPGGVWVAPTLVKHKEPLQRIMMSAFDPSIPLAE